MDSLNNRGSAKRRIMQAHSKPVDGFSDTSSAGSILDEADREVSSLTERAFKSLCVVEEGSCNEFEVHRSPLAVGVNHAAPAPEGKKYSGGKLKNCNVSPKVTKNQAKELPETFQESTGQYSVGEEKAGMGNGFLIEANEKNQQKSKVGAFHQCDRNFTGTVGVNAKPSSHFEPPGEDAIKDIAQFDPSAIISLHREKSSFSAACQENYWVTKKHVAQEKGSKTNTLGYLKSSQYRKPTDFKTLHDSNKKLDKALSEKVSRLKKLDTKNSFLHSECSAFKSWQDHSKSLFKEDASIQTQNPNVHLKASDEGTIAEKQAPSLVQAKSLNKVKETEMQHPVSRSPCNRDIEPHVPVAEENLHTVKGNQYQGGSPQMVRSEEGSGGMVENGVEEKGFQLWRNSRYPRNKMQMEAESVGVEEPTTKGPPMAEPVARGESPSFSISKLLTPNIVHGTNEAEPHRNQPTEVTPPFTQPCTNQGDEIKGDNQTLLGYKSKASNLMYSLKDVRKRVKSTYSPAVAPQNLSEPGKARFYLYQSTQQTSTRTSSAPVQLAIQENCATDASDQGKVGRVPSVADARPPADGLKVVMVPKGELDMGKNDNYLNLPSPQTVKEGGSYPVWRTRSSRPQSAMTASEIHAGRSPHRRASHQLNKPKTDLPTTTSQDLLTASGSPETSPIAQERAEMRRSKPECDPVCHSEKDGRTHERHSRRQEGALTSQRSEDAGLPTTDPSASSIRGSSHSIREDRTRQDLKLSSQSYIDLGTSKSQVQESLAGHHSKELCPGNNANVLKSRPAAENDKTFERNELEYYALSDPATSSERGGEKQATLMTFQSHSPQEILRGLPENKTKENGSAVMCEEKFYSIFSKQEEDRSGSNIPSSPRLGLFKAKENVLRTASGAKPTKLTLPKGVGEDAETPTTLPSNETPEGAKPDSVEMCLASSATPNPRPESTCSLDSKAAAKPPVVPPKSEKALRRAKKLATRRKRSESKQRYQSSEGAENDASPSVPMSPTSVPTSPLPASCSPAPQPPLTPCDFPALPDSLALDSAQSFTPLHSFPFSQQKLLQDPETGQYFVVDIPIQVQQKTLYDPETGNYFQVSIPSTGQNTTLDFFNTSYVLYPGFLSFPLTSSLRAPSQMSAPAVLLEIQREEESLNERTNFDLGYTEERENQPYIETLYDSHTGSRAASEKESWCSAINSQIQPEDHNLELIVMGDLEDIAIEND
ncbi:cardiac-enriched FHL2-interacting protein [Hypanus sabinus]|uniref:cardiac-enriched FHL2-interacting protein n=1 Tax=Hypanus sabinus TaxID=79690 RepID=UPI0028C455EB|nr:cardiac-enriched FHL2-interacting protein [Hypanus sabinus]